MRLLAALLVSSHLLAQSISVGLRTGIPVTPLLTADPPQQVRTPRFTIGPLLEVSVWHGVAVGADFLVRRTELAVSAAGSPRAGVWVWEAPVSLIYRFHAAARPFVRTGISFNRVFDISGATECSRGPFGETFYCPDGRQVAELRHRSTFGFVGGGGFRFNFRRFRLEPEVRLTHWADRNFGVQDSAVRSNLNQIGLLIGVIF